MQDIDWLNIKFFKRHEFDSPDESGSGNKMSYDLILKLDKLRDLCKFPLVPSSGFRTLNHNIIIKGAKNSAHLRGLAADILCIDNHKRYKILKYAYELNFLRIEIAPRHIHLDIDISLPQNIAIFLPAYQV